MGMCFAHSVIWWCSRAPVCICGVPSPLFLLVGVPLMYPFPFSSASSWQSQWSLSYPYGMLHCDLICFRYLWSFLSWSWASCWSFFGSLLLSCNGFSSGSDSDIGSSGSPHLQTVLGPFLDMSVAFPCPSVELLLGSLTFWIPVYLRR